MEAHERLALLSRPATPEVLDAAIAHMRELIDRGTLNPDDAVQLEAAAAELLAHGTMSGDVERAWHGLRGRLRDRSIITAIDDLDARVARGACRGGEVSAATVGFADGSYMILIDHGLATLTWLAAGLTATTADPVACARALRLALARPATRNSAGPTPSLALTTPEMKVAGALVAEMDRFLIGHEVAHILLRHVDLGGSPLGVVGGTATVIGKDPLAEHAADLLALSFLFDDTTAHAIPDQTAATRLSAVRLLLTVIEMYERQCFVLQPSSHPAAPLRWSHLVTTAVNEWFADDVPASDRVSAVIDAIGRLDSVTDIEADADVAQAELQQWLDDRLWSIDEWRDLAKMNCMLLTSGRRAVQHLLEWPGWETSDDPSARIEECLRAALQSQSVRSAVAGAARGEAPVTRIELAELIDTEVTHLVPRAEPPFPTWALAALAGDLIRASSERRRE